ncbi:MAG: bifunctional riboflavin kinase/FAD synthetase [Deltaproteobacteria bacterium]|nr:bifunctional riboflavin kinase/FAD synthetase [Deltaproteobacteria bacterium]
MVYYDLPPGPGPFSRTVVTIGNFDGVHLGHRAILTRVAARARELGSQPVALTFEPHPAKVLRPEVPLPLLTTAEQKFQLLKEAGMEAVVVLPFTREFSNLSARDFVVQYFVERLRAREVVVGHDYSFGRNREGNIELLKELGQTLGFTVQVVWAVEVNGAVVSSSLIRAMLRLGKVEKAAELLGRPYSVTGVVILGKGRGAKLLGIPTANIQPDNDLLPASGIYAVMVRWGEEVLPGVANIGTCPTFDGQESLSLEVHLFDFAGNLYGERLGVEFVARLREERRFPSVEALAAQIRADISAAKEALALSGKGLKDAAS